MTFARALRDGLRTAGLAAAFLLLFAVQIVAQTGETIDYSDWETSADQAEQTIEESEASNPELENLRADLAAWRDKFLTARNANQSRISTLQSQLDALGPEPEEGAEESDQIAARRSDLNSQLAELRAPVLRAEEAFNRADGLINEIDATIRERETERLLTLGPSPLNPVHWPKAVEGLLRAPISLKDEVVANWNSDSRSDQMRENGLAAAVVLAVGLLLFLRGAHWVRWLVNWLRRRTRGGTGVWGFLASLGLILVPVAGLFALALATELSGLLGFQGMTLVALAPVVGLYILGAQWLCEQAISREGGAGDALNLQPQARAEAHWHGVALGVILALRLLATRIADLEELDDAARAVLDFPFLALTGLFLFRLGQLLSRAGEGLSEAAAEPQFRHAVTRILGRIAMVIAVAGPVLAAIGFREAAVAMVYPAVHTLALLSFVLILQRFATDVYRFVTRTTDDDDEGLIPVLVGIVLVLLAAPLLALVWGTRPSQLLDLWTRFREGFTLGETNISPTDFMVFVVVFVLGYGLTRLVQGMLRSSVLPKTKIDPGGQSAIVAGLGYVGIMLAAVLAITSAGIDLTALGYVAGALSVGIGFGLQNIVQNFVSGIILLIERPISEGDWVQVGTNMGYVKDISVRSTRIETFDRTDVIVPNADFISGTVTNYTRGNTVGRVIVAVGVAYGTDTRKVEKILQEIAEDHPMVLMNPPPTVVFQGFGASSLDFEIRAILRDVNWVLNVKSDMNHQIAKRFSEEGVEIPFPQSDIWFRNPETLRGATQAANDSRATPGAGDADHGTDGAAPRAPMKPDESDLSGGDPSGGESGDGDR
ncbi:DUF3772 domain-containing protein [Aquicoccus sp. SCR17]|nr:DUF3772 domain-containing protein [Carideicomes alvinocaridis]